LIDVGGWVFLLIQIFFVDLLLGADNVVVIALACSKLRREDARRALMLGAAGAIALRLVMLLFANALLDVPLVKLIGAWTLIVIALNVRAATTDERLDASAGGDPAASDFVAAAAIIMLADAAMSLDNVVALASIAGGDFWLLATGVLMSVPILAYGSLILTQIIRSAPGILTLGAVILGWIAGGMAVSDPLLSGWIRVNAPALAVFAPALIAAFVWIAGRGAEGGEARRTSEREPVRALAPEPPSETASGRLRPPSPPSRPAQERARSPAPSTIGLKTAAPEGPPSPVVAERSETAANGGWSEERVVVVGFVVLAALAGIIIFIASLLDSLT
jgi:YjbE family integral membrane protein